MMEAIVFFIFLAIIALLIFLYVKNNKKRPMQKEAPIQQNTARAQNNISTNSPERITEEVEKVYPYAKKMLLTKAEYAFYKVLKAKCDQNNMLICPKVRMEDFLIVTDKKNTLKYRGYIKSRHIDFMICDDRLYLLAGIELDDNSHMDKDTAEKDEFKNKVFQTINLPLFRIKMSQGMYEKQIDEVLNSITQGNTAIKTSVEKDKQ